MINCFSVLGQTCDCNKFRTGNFEVSNPDGTVSQIKRTETKQIERTGKVKTTHAVVWVDACTFKLKPLSIKDKSERISSDVVKVVFIETYDHGYLAKVSIEGTDIQVNAMIYERGYLNSSKSR